MLGHFDISETSINIKFIRYECLKFHKGSWPITQKIFRFGKHFRDLCVPCQHIKLNSSKFYLTLIQCKKFWTFRLILKYRKVSLYIRIISIPCSWQKTFSGNWQSLSFFVNYIFVGFICLDEKYKKTRIKWHATKNLSF